VGLRVGVAGVPTVGVGLASSGEGVMLAVGVGIKDSGSGANPSAINPSK